MPWESDFIYSPYGCGWHLDRAAFDAQLLKCADERGARIMHETRLQSVERNGAGWLITAKQGDREVQVKGTFLIDATGRSAWLARRMSVERIKFDNLIGIAAFFHEVQFGDARTMLEAAEDGWWYAAKLPNQPAASSR